MFSISPVFLPPRPLRRDLASNPRAGTAVRKVTLYLSVPSLVTKLASKPASRNSELPSRKLRELVKAHSHVLLDVAEVVHPIARSDQTVSP